MKYLYVDNFKGFINTTIPLVNVNFLVGENSTGKTSIMSLIGIFSDFKFWFEPEFGNDNIDLGFFDEIANKGSNKNYFWVGFYDGKSPNGYFGVFLKFISNNNLPIVNEAKYIEKNGVTEIVIEKNRVKYKFSKEKFNESVDLFEFNKWNAKRAKSESEWKELNDSKTKIYSTMPFYFILNLIQNEINKIKKKKPNIGFSSPIIFNNLTWIAPIRAKAKKTYDSYRVHHSPEGDHIPYKINDLQSQTKDKNKKNVLNKLKLFGENSGLFDKINTRKYGKENTSPFALNVELEGLSLNISNVGYGVSQIIPIIYEVLTGRKSSWYAIQQPEVHLHPKAQATLGSFFYEASISEDKKLIIETHSDFIIDRFRYEVKKGINKPKSQILFFEKKGSNNFITPIIINEDGSYSNNQPQSFKEFFIEEEFMKLEI